MNKKGPTWRRLRRYGNSKVIRSSYIWVILVPIIAKLIPQLELMLSSDVYAIDLQLPFSWQMFYFGSVCFAIASFIYSSKCPHLIQSYAIPDDYWGTGHGLRELDAYAKSTFGDLGDEGEELLREYSDTRATLAVGVVQHTKADLNSKFFFLQEKTQFKRYWSRVACLIGYGLGMLFFFIVLVENFMYVVNEVGGIKI